MDGYVPSEPKDGHAKMYACKEADGFYTIRQERFRGKSHPNDVCAVAPTVAVLKEIANKYWMDVDYSAVDSLSDRLVRPSHHRV